MSQFLFFSFLASDFSSYYLDFFNNKPNSLIPNNGSYINNYNGIYNNIYLYMYNGIYSSDIYNNNITVSLSIYNSILYVNNKGIQKFLNNQEWVFPLINIYISGIPYELINLTFNPIFLTNNKSQFKIINQIKGFTFPKKSVSWYTNYSPTENTTLSFQLIWGQGDIPQEYYSICGFPGTINVKAQNPFTNSNGPYYGTYISSNDNYASNSGWIIVLGGNYDSTLVNPPYLEDV